MQFNTTRSQKRSDDMTGWSPHGQCHPHGHPEMHQWDIKYNDIIHGIDRTYAEGTLTHLSVSFSGLKFEIQTLATRQ